MLQKAAKAKKENDTTKYVDCLYSESSEESRRNNSQMHPREMDQAKAGKGNASKSLQSGYPGLFFSPCFKKSLEAHFH